MDIFWRRAVFSNNGHIYCMVNGNQLKYEVSDKGERRLEKHMQKAVDQGTSSDRKTELRSDKLIG